ncbi:unnamed protein product [Mytilus edulis]|uniref:Uncharacterized protein n=1 Tax=Mytilus edulis TaxID=6550 RepID=A0A8S3SWC9_MYTED|nr:unnamed protein product [Mytilus edulis]
MNFVIVEGAHLRSHFLIQLLNLHVHTLETLHFSTKYDVGNFSYKQQLSEKPLLDMAYAHDRLTKHFGKDGKEAKISHEFAREKALNFLAVMENTKDNIRTQSNTKNAEVLFLCYGSKTRSYICARLKLLTKLKIATGSYILQTVRAKFKSNTELSIFNETEETLPHFLLTCKSLEDIRKPILEDLINSCSED